MTQNDVYLCVSLLRWLDWWELNKKFFQPEWRAEFEISFPPRTRRFITFSWDFSFCCWLHSLHHAVMLTELLLNQWIINIWKWETTKGCWGGKGKVWFHLVSKRSNALSFFFLAAWLSTVSTLRNLHFHLNIINWCKTHKRDWGLLVAARTSIRMISTRRSWSLVRLSRTELILSTFVNLQCYKL